MKRALIISALVATAIGVTSVAALAKDGGPRGHGPRINFEEADLNSDGMLTTEEMTAFAKARFDLADTNGDGGLSVEEMTARAQVEMQERFAKRSTRILEHKDTNKDGILSFDEMKPDSDRTEKMFSRLDKDADGAISAEEFETARQGHGKKRFGHGGGQDGHKGQHKMNMGHGAKE